MAKWLLVFLLPPVGLILCLILSKGSWDVAHMRSEGSGGLVALLLAFSGYCFVEFYLSWRGIGRGPVGWIIWILVTVLGPFDVPDGDRDEELAAFGWHAFAMFFLFFPLAIFVDWLSSDPPKVYAESDVEQSDRDTRDDSPPDDPASVQPPERPRAFFGDIEDQFLGTFRYDQQAKHYQGETLHAGVTVDLHLETDWGDRCDSALARAKQVLSHSASARYVTRAKRYASNELLQENKVGIAQADPPVASHELASRMTLTSMVFSSEGSVAFYCDIDVLGGRDVEILMDADDKYVQADMW